MTSKLTRSRRSGAAALLVVLTLISGAAPADAQSTRERLKAQEQKLAGLKSRAGQIAASLARTDRALQDTRGQIDRTKVQKARAEAEMAGLRQRLKDRVREAYRNRGIGFFQFLLEAESFDQFNRRLMYLQRQTLGDEDLILKLRKTRHELDIHEAELDRQEGALSSQKNSLVSQTRQMTITLEEQNKIYAALKDQYSREQLARLFRVIRGPARGGMSVPLDACPVAGPRAVSNDYGAPRGGGRRRHQGNDIMAPHGAPLVAVVSGRVTRTGNGGLGGKTVYLFGSGTEFYYAHLSSISVSPGQSVSAGQTVGANGNTGNASGGPPHLHFEIHPGGGRAIDPYPSLSRVC